MADDDPEPFLLVIVQHVVAHFLEFLKVPYILYILANQPLSGLHALPHHLLHFSFVADLADAGDAHPSLVELFGQFFDLVDGGAHNDGELRHCS